MLQTSPLTFFTEQALSRSAELTLNAGDYTEALELCNRLESTASGKWNILRANFGQMRSHLFLNRITTMLFWPPEK
jgi:hypothetical protein